VVADTRRQALWTLAAAVIALAVALAFASPGRTPQPPRVNTYLPWHTAAVDAHGNLQPWYRPRGGLGYDHVLRLGWSFIAHGVPLDRRTGRRVYFNYAVFDQQTRQGTYWQHDPAELYASFAEALLPWYAYSGDRGAVTRVRAMLDYQLEHGTSPARWAWPDIPFPTSCAGDVRYGRCLAGMPKSFYGGIEPDKVGLLGLAYARFYELTGDDRFLGAAAACANALARHVRAGDAARSPWPFRLDARTGRTLEHAEYGGMTVAPVWLFDELIRLHVGDAALFSRARELAWRWILRYPLNPRSVDWNRWSGHYEDIDYDPDDLNQAIPTTTALYLLMHPDPGSIDPAWRVHVHELLAWVRSYLGRGPFRGAWAIDEQRKPSNGAFACCSPAGLGSDTARWAAATLLLSRDTDEADARATGRHSLAYATYFMQSDGVVSCCGAGYPEADWFSDGYADYLKSFSLALAADPRLAPAHEDHVLGSTSVVQSVSYARGAVAYRTFAKRSVEVMRLAFVPRRVLADGRPLPRRSDLRRPGFVVGRLGKGDVVVRVRHDDARNVAVGYCSSCR
jgi:hypothetical protein